MNCDQHLTAAEQELAGSIALNLGFSMSDEAKVAEPPENLPEAEAFGRLMAQLDPDPEVAGREYVKIRGNLIRYFKVKGEISSEEAADEVFDRVVARIREGVTVEDVVKYCVGIARLVALERFRRGQREQTAWFMFADMQAQSFAEAREQSYLVMNGCLAELSEEDRRLLLTYYQAATNDERTQQRAKLAATMNASLNKLRLRVYRLRHRLMDCVKQANAA